VAILTVANTAPLSNFLISGSLPKCPINCTEFLKKEKSDEPLNFEPQKAQKLTKGFHKRKKLVLYVSLL